MTRREPSSSTSRRASVRTVVPGSEPVIENGAKSRVPTSRPAAARIARDVERLGGERLDEPAVRVEELAAPEAVDVDLAGGPVAGVEIGELLRRRKGPARPRELRVQGDGEFLRR